MQKAEDYYPPFRDGFYMDKPAVFGKDMTVNGDVMVNGNVLADNIGGGPGIISDAGATRQLLASESGSICLFNRAAGITYTLPAASPGLSFRFFSTVAVTSNSYKVLTADTSTFLMGHAGFIGSNGSTRFDYYDQTGTTNRALNWTPLSANKTTGGQIGTDVLAVALSTTLWYITGFTVGGTGGDNGSSFATS